MKQILPFKQKINISSPALSGGKFLFAFAGIFFLILSAAYPAVFSSVPEEQPDVIRAIQEPELSGEALRGDPLRPVERLVRTVRQNNICRLLKFRSAALQPVSAAALKDYFRRNLREHSDIADFQQKLLQTTILVRAGPVCFENNSKLFKTTKK